MQSESNLNRKVLTFSFDVRQPSRDIFTHQLFPSFYDKSKTHMSERI